MSVGWTWGGALTLGGDAGTISCGWSGSGDVTVGDLDNFTSSNDYSGTLTARGVDGELTIEDDGFSDTTTYPAGTSIVYQGAANNLAINPPEDATITATTDGGFSLNEDGGDDVYLIADDGGALLGGLNEVTAEVAFAISTPPPSTVALVSYTEGAHDEELGLFVTNTGQIIFATEADSSPVQATASAYPELLDGNRHHVAVSWDSSNGAVEFYIDGQNKESFTGYQTGLPLDGGGTLVLGNDQDSIDGGYDPNQAFKGVLYDVRVFDDVRTASEIATYHAGTLSRAISSIATMAPTPTVTVLATLSKIPQVTAWPDRP